MSPAVILQSNPIQKYVPSATANIRLAVARWIHEVLCSILFNRLTALSKKNYLPTFNTPTYILSAYQLFQQRLWPKKKTMSPFSTKLMDLSKTSGGDRHFVRQIAWSSACQLLLPWKWKESSLKGKQFDGALQAAFQTRSSTGFKVYLTSLQGLLWG